MTVPWTGFPMTELLKLAEPLGSAKYLAFETVQDKSMAGLDEPLYPWPYVDGLAIDEAGNELAFITTGMSAKPLPPQNGGPIRMTTPCEIWVQAGEIDHIKGDVHRQAAIASGRTSTPVKVWLLG